MSSVRRAAVADEAIRIRRQLRRPHPLVIKTRDAYRDVKPDEDGRMRPRPRDGVVRLIVSRKQLPRALRVLQAIFLEAERRDWEVRAAKKKYDPAGVAIVIREHAYNVSIGELHERVPMTSDDLARWRRDNEWKLRWYPDRAVPTMKSVPNGLLRLSLPSHRGRHARSSWAEGPRGDLDHKLPAFFAELERRATADDRRAEGRRQEQELRRERELEQLERERQQQIELARTARLKDEVAAWQLAADVRDYVATLRTQAAVLTPTRRTRINAWCDWALDWAARHDPGANPELVQGLEADEPISTGSATSRISRASLERRHVEGPIG